MSDLLAAADVDPVAAALAYLKAVPEVVDAFGGADHISGEIEAPWPRLRISDGPGGSLGNLRWATAPEIMLEVFGDPTGWPGKAEVRRLTMLAAAALVRLPEQDPPAPGPVVALVTVGTLSETPLTSGQPHYSLTLSMVMHPAPS
jgi:hypothetical protein